MKSAESFKIMGRGRVAYDCTDLIKLFMSDAELVGFLIGDGCVSSRTHSSEVGLYSGSLFESSWLEAKVKVLNVPYHKCECGRFGHAFIISRKGLVDRLLAEGCGGRSWEKRVPGFIMRGTQESKRGFLRGLFQADGCITFPVKCQISCSTVSLGLVEGVVKLLLEEGVEASVYKLPYKGCLNGRDCYEIRVRGLSSRLSFLNKIGFSFGEKLRRVEYWIGHYSGLSLKGRRWVKAMGVV